MSKITSLLKSRLFLAFIGIVFMSIFVWIAGPMFGFNGRAPLESAASRYLAIGGMSALWLLTAVLRFIKSRRDNAQLLDSIAEESVSAQDNASADERAELQRKMQEAVSTLKRRNFSANGGSRFIYELPWYTIIGPPGAGKTTLLSNSGLDFPLGDSNGELFVKGVGGTRNCDWWFTDQAVLLDTAGRYLTQDSEAEVDRSAWTHFLELLRQTRKRRPLNGVLVAVSVEDLVKANEHEIKQLANTIRTRVDELYEKLGIAPPVYLIFTKCDLLAGFTEFFSNLDKTERGQVWGFTLPVDDNQNTNELLSLRMKELVTTLGEQVIEKLHREMSQRKREQVYGFPIQFSLLQQNLLSFSQLLLTRSNLMQPVFFRGIYFSSATQSGHVMDQVVAKIARKFGTGGLETENRSGTGRSYFINRLLTDVVFNEAGLAGTNIKVEKRLARFQIAASVLIGTVLLGFSGFWIASFFDNRDALARVRTDAESFTASSAQLPANSLDLLKVNELLSNAINLKFNPDGRIPDETDFVARRTGLYQGNAVNEMVDSKYQEMLIDALLPRLMVRLEHQMHAESNNNEFLFEALKTYQMLDSKAHFDTDEMVGWFNFDFDVNLPPDTTSTDRSELKFHVSQLFQNKPYRLPRPLDKSLITQFQRIAATLSTEQRAYSRIRNSTRADSDPFFRLSVEASPDISTAFTRADEVSLDQSIPGFFTREGFNNVFLPASAKLSSAVAEDIWVLGDAARDGAEQSQDGIIQAVKQTYFTEYIEYWDGLIKALQLKPVSGLQEASALISLLSDTDSPLKKLLVTIAEQTTLTKAPAADEETGEAGTGRENDLKELLANDNAIANLTSSEQTDPVTRHYARLHALVADWDTNSSRLDETLAQLADINLQLVPMAQTPAGSIDPALNTQLAVNLQNLEAKAGRLPDPVASLVKDLNNDIGDVVGGGRCQQLDAIWKTDVHAYYRRAIQGRYPVNRNATSDIAQADFGAFFAPGGIVDRFVDAHLSSLVSKTPGQWTWVGKESSVCVSDNTLKQLARAEDIKNTFFSGGGNTPAFSFELRPDQGNLSNDIQDLFITIGDEQVNIDHGKVPPKSFTWPGNNTFVSLRAAPVVPGTTSSIDHSGPWAVLRMFEQGARKPFRGGLSVTYSLGGRNATLVLATSSFNPLDSVALRNFRAPENL